MVNYDARFCEFSPKLKISCVQCNFTRSLVSEEKILETIFRKKNLRRSGKITLYTRNFHFRTEFTKACIIIYHNSSSKCEASYYYWIIIAWNDESLSSAVIPSDLWKRNCFITCYSCFGWWKLNTCSQSYSGTAQFILKKTS